MKIKYECFDPIYFKQLLIVVDGSMVAEHKDEVKFYVLNIIKMVISLKILPFLQTLFFKVDSIFKDRSVGNHIKVETVKVMSLEGATFGYMRHSGSNKVCVNEYEYMLMVALFRFQHLRC